MKNTEINPDEELERLQQANEAKKKKLTEEFGAHFGEMNNSSLSPEIESQFLDNIMAFEDAWKDSEQITLYEFLGNPDFVKSEDLADEDVSIQLNRINKLMEENQVSLDTLCEVDDRELYRFITEELFQTEIDDIHIPGMITHYTYEEFHPNHEYDIRNHSSDFMSAYLNHENDYYKHQLTSEAENMDWHVHFRQAFSSFTLHTFEISNLEFDTENAKVQFYCNFTGNVEGSSELFQFTGNGEISLKYMWDFWCIDSIMLPKGKIC